MKPIWQLGMALSALLTAPPVFAQCGRDGQTQAAETSHDTTLPCPAMETVTILGSVTDIRDIAGGASEIRAETLQAFSTSDVVRALRRVPGAALQAEDGYGLRPNISIRGTPSERSSRITLLEDNVLIAPAPYAAPSAYYFPTFGRIHSVEVLKGPAAITQGPYTIGGALNLLSTPIPDQRQGLLKVEGGSDNNLRTHAWYGDSNSRSAWLVETHQWQSDGYQTIDRSSAHTGLDKSDYLAKFSLLSDPGSAVAQRLDIKLQRSEEDSEQSYLGLTDNDFSSRPLRRYGVSGLDAINNRHEQVVVGWHIEPSAALELFVTAYDNRTERAWYKTEGIDFDGSSSADAFQRTGWASVIDAINQGSSVNGYDSVALQAILDGADTAAGSIQLRNNARAYVSRGVQTGGSYDFETTGSSHSLSFGLRLHRDEEDRMQRNDSYQQLDGRLVLNDRGALGAAGNRLQKASARSLFLHDRIESGAWVWTPGIRYEDISQTRIDFGADADDPAGREGNDVSRVRRNQEAFWIPGLGVLYQASDQWSVLGGIHRGFSAPGDRQGVDAEVSTNYEAGVRFQGAAVDWEAVAFFHDYQNLQGVCTASSGSGCEIGDVFNGDAVTIPGLEFMLTTDLAEQQSFNMPLSITYTWMRAQFQSDIADSAFFGDVHAGDPVPYVPNHQLFVSLGFEQGAWSTYLSGNYTDAVCTRARCGPFEQTESSMVFDLGVHRRLTPKLELYAVVENLSEALDIAGRQPYGARPGKARSWLLGARLDF